MRDRRCQAGHPDREDIAIGLAVASEPFNNDDLIDLSSGGRCMLTGLPFRETPVGSVKRYRTAPGKPE